MRGSARSTLLAIVAVACAAPGANDPDQRVSVPTPALSVALPLVSPTDTAAPSSPCEPTRWYADTDGDGWFGEVIWMESCEQPPGFGQPADDCDDRRPEVHPGAAEQCDGLDNDCDGALTPAELTDNDSDGSSSCFDCDDERASVSPLNVEICDGIDNDCDGLTDEVPTESWIDADGDGYGDRELPIHGQCGPGAGEADNPDDCDDLLASVNPGSLEVCDPYRVDEDCNGSADDGDPELTGPLVTAQWWRDADGDGFGVSPMREVTDCDGHPSTSGWASVDGDCDDTRDGVRPGADERCGDGVDNDCNPRMDCGLVTPATIDDGYARILGSEAHRLNRVLAAGTDLTGNGVPDIVFDGTPTGLYIHDTLTSGDVLLGDAVATVANATSRISFQDASVGDINGDGAADLAVAAAVLDGPQEPAVFVFYGPITGEIELSLADAVFTVDTAVEHVEVVDVDADGRADLLASEGCARPSDLCEGLLHIVLGPRYGTARLSDVSDTTLIGARVAGTLGDANQDGVADVYTGAVDGVVSIHYGPLPGGTHQVAVVREGKVRELASRNSSGPVVSALDVNGDGVRDLLLSDTSGINDGGVVNVVLAPFGATTNTADFSIRGVAGSHDNIGKVGVVALGDVNGDGDADFGLAAVDTSGPAVANPSSAAHVWFGPVNASIDLANGSAAFVSSGEGDQSLLPFPLGNVNSDGDRDLVVVAPRGGAGAAGVAYFFLGGPGE